MALGTTDITTTLVKNTLGEDQTAVYHLCDSPLINKWSKYKPVVGSWPTAEAGNYALNLPVNWNYISIINNGRLGDFRGYEHNTSLAFPTIHSLTSEEVVTTLNPTTGPTNNSWKIRIYNAASSVRITPSDLGLSNYYVGLKVWGGCPTSYKTYFQVSAGSENGTDIQIQATYDYENDNFFDLPYGSGTYNYMLFLGAYSTTGWETSYPGLTIPFPNEGIWNGDGAFIVTKFIYVSDPAPFWVFNQYGIGTAQRIYLGSSGAFKYTSVPASDIYGWTIRNAETTQIGENESGASGDYIDIWPNAANQSLTTDKVEDLIIILDADTNITRTISLTQSRDTTPQPPTIGYWNNSSDPWDLTEGENGHIDIGSRVLYYDFYHNETTNVYSYYVNIIDINENVVYSGGGGSITIEPETPHVTGSFTINRDAVADEAFTVIMYHA